MPLTRSDAHAGVLPTPARRTAPLFRAGVAIVLASVAMIAVAGLGSRWGWWSFRTGFTLLRWAGYAALLGALVTIVGAALPGRGHRRPIWRGVAVAALALATVAVPWQWRRTARRVPPIHDITTDTERPPEFVTLRDRRPGARNPVVYGGAETAAQQRSGYPDIVPLALAIPPAAALQRSAQVARDFGWTIAVVDPVAGRMEATDRTRWFGFRDDVVVRVTPAPGGSRVDVRSLSRVGGSDVGTNAARIRRFLAALRAAS